MALFYTKILFAFIIFLLYCNIVWKLLFIDIVIMREKIQNGKTLCPKYCDHTLVSQWSDEFINFTVIYFF